MLHSFTLASAASHDKFPTVKRPIAFRLFLLVAVVALCVVARITKPVADVAPQWRRDDGKPVETFSELLDASATSTNGVPPGVPRE